MSKLIRRLSASTLYLSLGLISCQSTQRASTGGASVHPPPSAEAKVYTPRVVKAEDTTARLQGAKGVEKWEPSGVARIGEDLWVVSDKDGWLARYPLPLSPISEPTQVTQLKVPLDNRLKWEGLEVHPEGGLLLMEAISRSVWWCKDPKAGCTELSRLEAGAINDELNTLAHRPFYYLMFEALTVIDGRAWVGVRGMNAKPSADHEGGLVPWIAWASFGAGEPQPIIPPAQGGAPAFTYEGRSYGLSGAVNDGEGGLWVTLSYEDEEGDSRASVSGVLARLKLPLSPTKLTGEAPELSVCARFELKPEGVTLSATGAPIVVFDVDADRKGDTPERFNLKRTEDYIWVAPQDVKGCVAP